MKKQIRFTLLIFIFSIPFTYVPAMATDTLRTEVGPGITFIKIHDLRKPLHVVALEIDISNPATKITTVVPNGRFDQQNELVANMAKRKTKEGRLVIGGMNGDFWSTSPAPGYWPYRLINGQISNGEYAYGGHRSGRDSFGMTADGMPIIDRITFAGHIELADESRFSLNGINNALVDNGLILYNSYTGSSTRSDDSAIEWELTPLEPVRINRSTSFEVTRVTSNRGNMPIPDGKYVLTGTGETATQLHGLLEEGDLLDVTMQAVSHTDPNLINHVVTELIGGNPRLILDGVVSTNHGDRHPRSAVGINKDSTKVIFAVADGRQHFSRGASIAEMAEVMESLGAWQAVNVDGGGSSTLVVRDEPKNDHDLGFGLGTYRPVANAMLVVIDTPFEDLAAELYVEPREAVIDTSESVTFSASVMDHWAYSLPDTDKDIAWEMKGLSGSMDEKGTFTPYDYGEGYIIAHYGELSDSVFVLVEDPLSAEQGDNDVPESFQLFQNHPNPFNPVTVISYALPRESHVKLAVHDITGRKVALLAKEHHAPGRYEVNWDATNKASGIYVYRLEAGGEVLTRRMTLVK